LSPTLRTCVDRIASLVSRDGFPKIADRAVSIARDAQRQVQTARWQVAGTTEGNRNAWKHGGRSVEAIRLRREINALARLARVMGR
jgi:hypothetical protein